MLHDVYFITSKFKALADIAEYLTDENFVIAARDRFRENIYETEFEGGPIENRILLYKANKALDAAVQKAKQGTMGGN